MRIDQHWPGKDCRHSEHITVPRAFIIIGLLIILILASVLRFSGIEWGVPSAPIWRNYFQDEAWALSVVLQMNPARFDFNPHNFVNPSLHFYTMLGALKLAAAFNYLRNYILPMHIDPLGNNESEETLEEYNRMFKVARSLTILEGILTVLLVYLIGANLFSPVIGLIAASLMAVIPAHVYHSHFLVYDQAPVFWLTLALWWLTTDFFKTRKIWWYIICGILIGLAIGVKYTNLFLLLTFYCRQFFIAGDRKKHRITIPIILKEVVFSKISVLVLLTTILTFIISTPYAILSPHEFLFGDRIGWGGVFGARGLFYYMNFPFSLTKPFTVGTWWMLPLPLFIIAAGGYAYQLVRRRKQDLILLSFSIIYYLTLIYHASPHSRHYIPLAPFLAISAALMIWDFPRWLLKLSKPRMMVISAVLFCVPFLYTLDCSYAQVRRMLVKDTRDQSRDWVIRNIALSDTIALASYFPWAYTPAIDLTYKNIVVTGYNYDRLMAARPEYFLITQQEFRDKRQNQESDYIANRFLKNLFAQRDYRIVADFKYPYKGFMFTHRSRFPSFEWDVVSPEIVIFQRIRISSNP